MSQAAVLSTPVSTDRKSITWQHAFKRNHSAMVGLAVLALLGAVAILAPWIAPASPSLANARNALAPPSADHLLGTDNLGRDILSRLIWGARWSLGMSLVAGLAIATIGTTVGLVAGYVGGWVDDALMRVVDVLLALPGIVVALAVVGMTGPGLTQILVAIVLVWWADYARLVRAITLRLRQEEFVSSAKCAGVSPVRILFSHILPNILPSSLVVTSMNLGSLLLALAGLSFLGFGAQPPTPEWGTMLENGRPFFQRAPQLMLYPGLLITVAAISFNLVGDGLRDALDPRLRHHLRHH